MTVEQTIVAAVVVFATLGAADKIFGNRFGLGDAFEEGVRTIGILSLVMIGMICMAPVIAKWCRPVITPFYTALGADPSMFAGTLLACDMGGAPLARELTNDVAAADFSGMIVGSLLGPTVSFLIPTLLAVLDESDRPSFVIGILSGVVTIPIGAFVGGLVAGFSPLMILRNLTPILPVELCILLGMWKARRLTVKAFLLFGRLIQTVITLGLLFGIIQGLTGIEILPGMAPISEGFETVSQICMMLAGVFPLVVLLKKALRPVLSGLGKRIGINEEAAAGLVTTLANSIPVLDRIRLMDRKGKIVNIAFAVSASFVFGDHLGFAAGFAPNRILPMIVAKLVAGVTAAIVGWFAADKIRE